MFYDDSQGLVRVVVVGAARTSLWSCCCASPASGRWPSSRVRLRRPVALGSTLATLVLSSTVNLAEGVTALGLLVGLQYLVAWASTRSRRVERLVKSEPTLVHGDDFLPAAMRREPVTANELRQAARGQAHADVTDVGAIVMETDGTLSVLTGRPFPTAVPGSGDAAERRVARGR